MSLQNQILLQLPSTYIFPGESFNVIVYGYTSYTISGFSLVITLDPMLTVSAIDIDTLVWNYETATSENNFAISALLSTPSDDTTPIDFAQTLLFSLSVAVSSDIVDEYDALVSAAVESVSNIVEGNLLVGDSTNSTSGPAIFVGRDSSATTTGSVYIIPDRIAALLPHIEQPEILNTAVLTNEIVSRNVSVTVAYQSGRVESYSGDINCTSNDSIVTVVNHTCYSIQLTGNELEGGDAVIVFTVGSVTGELNLRIFHPELSLLQVTALDTELNRIEHTLNSGACTDVYQYTPLSVFIGYSAGTTTISDVDVTALVSELLESSDETVVRVDSLIARGLSPGSANICVVLGGISTGCQQVTVTDTPVHVDGLSVSLVAGLDVAADSTSILSGSLSTLTATANSTISFEGDGGEILSAVQYTDGAASEIDTADISFGTISLASLDGNRVSAGVIEGVEQLDFTWAPQGGQCGLSVSDSLDIVAAFPDPVAVTTYPPPDTVHRLTLMGDSATLVGIATSVQVTVQLHYDDGRSIDLTPDRITYIIITADIIAINDQTGTVTATGTGIGASLIIQFEHTSLTTAIEFEIVTSTLTLSVFPYPPYPGSDSNPTAQLSPIEDTGVWQMAIVSVQLVLSNNSMIDITKHSNTIISVNTITTPVLELSSDVIITASQAGQRSEVIVQFGSLSTSQTIESVADPVTITSIAVIPLSNDTLRGSVSSPGTQLTVDITFSDDTQIVDYPSNPALLQLLPGLLNFSTSSQAMAITDAGIARPVENSLVQEPITVEGGSLGVEYSVFVNLEPDVGDVDLGEAIWTITPSTSISIPLRINTGASDLGAIDVIIYYDPTVLEAVGGELGPDWGSGMYEIVINSPPGEMRVGGAMSADCVSGSMLHLFMLQFTALAASSETRISGAVLTLTERGVEAAGIGEPTPRDIIAGNITFATGASLRKRSASLPHLTNKRISTYGKRVWKRQTDACSSPPCSCSGTGVGDVDGNCMFDIRDVSYSLLYITESLLNFSTDEGRALLARTSANQMRQLDANLDGAIDTSDTYFLLRAVFQLVYFVEGVTVTPVNDTESECLFSVEIQLTSGYEGLGMGLVEVGDVDVFLDLGFSSAELHAGFASSNTTVGDIISTNKGDGLFGGVVRALRVNASEGRFQVRINSSFVASDIGLSILLVTYDARNTTDSSRMAQFFGTSPYTYPNPLTLSLPARGREVTVLRSQGYSPLRYASNLLLSEDCSDVPLIDSQLNATFTSPFEVVLEWTLQNMRTGLDFRSQIKVYIMACDILQTGLAIPNTGCDETNETGTTGLTNHTTSTQPFREYTFQIQGPTTQSQRLVARSPEAVPEELAPPTVVFIANGYSFSWQLPSSPNGLITYYILYIGSAPFYNGSALSVNITGVAIAAPQSYYLESYNSAGAASSETQTLDPLPEVTDPEATVARLTIGQAVGVVTAVAVVLVVLLLLVMFVATVSRRMRTEKPPAFLSHNFEPERAGVEEHPQVGDSVDVLLPLGEQKGKHFAEKFGKEEKTTFWYQDERRVELVPPQYESSDGDSSDTDSVNIGLDIGEWAYDPPPATAEESDLDMSDLWVVEDTSVATESKGRKYSLRRKNTGTGRSGDQSKRLHKFSLRRRGSRSTAVGRGEGGDRVKLVESEGGEVEVAPVGERDVMSDDEIENVKFQLASLKRKRDSKMMGIDMEPPIKEEEEEEEKSEKDEPPPPIPPRAEVTTETAQECATRLRRIAQSGEYRRQYKELAAVKPRSGHSNASLPCNAGKNRYRNVLAPDHSRVRILNSDPQVEGSDYINANYLDSYTQKKVYIATQAPLPATVADFWRLAWQQGVTKIVMTCNTVEDGRMKCEKYWPDAEKAKSYGPTTVQCTTSKQHRGYVETVLLVSCGKQSREVTHYQYTTWPDFGTPRTPTDFLELVRSVGGTREGSPILVHCSAGLGRSGVFVAVHSSLDAQANSRRVDVETAVREMRKQRAGMVQTPEQYRFCFEAVAEALDPLLPAEAVPKRQSELSKNKPVMADPPRPFSQPLIDQDTPRSQRRKLYLQDSFPPPPSYPPPQEEAVSEALRHVSSPPPPSSSPPPPLTPSTSTETTPKKLPFLETSPEATPTKQPDDTAPEIIVTPPTRHPSMSSVNQEFESVDRKLVQRKLKSFREEGGESAEEKKQDKEKREGQRESKGSAPTKPTTSAVKSIKKPPTSSRSALRDVRKPEPSSKKQPSLKRKKDEDQVPLPATREPNTPRGEQQEAALSEDELTKTLEGFEVPPPGRDLEPPEEEGFQIGDDQILKDGPPPKMEVKKPEDKPKPKWGGGAPIRQPVAHAPSTGGTKLRKWGQVSPSHSQAPATSPVNRGGEEKKESVQKVGKLVMPGIFGAAAKPTTPPASPERKPVSPVPQPAKPTPLQTRETTPASKPEKPVANQSETGDTPPVMRMIRLMEAGRQKTSPTTQPPHRPTPVSEPVKPVKQEPPKPVRQEPLKQDKPAEQDSPAVSNFTNLLARFEKKS